jgi:hypothetical protein
MARRETQDDVKHYPGDGKDAGVETRQYLTCDLSHTSRDATHGRVEKGGEPFSVGVSTNARGGTSTKDSAITTVNRCKGERGRHNYRSRYGFENSSSEGDMYSSNEDPYGEHGESFGVGVSTNTRDGTSSKIFDKYNDKPL